MKIACAMLGGVGLLGGLWLLGLCALSLGGHPQYPGEANITVTLIAGLALIGTGIGLIKRG